MGYPVEKASTIPASGTALYIHLLENIDKLGSLPHMIWYGGEKAKIDNPRHSFRGFFPTGETLRISYAGSEMQDYTFTGKEQNNVFVSDLSAEARMKLAIPKDADPGEKVFNPKFLSWKELTDETCMLNKLPTLALAKTISDWCCSKGNIYYSEKDVQDFLLKSLADASSDEMMFILNGNHIAWASNTYANTGVMEPDIKRQFYAQDNADFYIKDIGTIMPSILYTLTILGNDPMILVDQMTYDVWGIREVATELQLYVYGANLQKVA